ncbi:MAG TPA: TIGR02391 family protein [Phycisphaerales bacterium]|nr:TIGR02391 family protein [Phycisphaerales bacterium]
METLRYRERIDPFDAQHLESIARVLADTSDGLTGSQIGYLLQDCRIPDTDPTMTKWKRLFNAFVGFQRQHRVGNHVVVFIRKAMNPVSYTSNPSLFQLRRDGLNKVLAFRGMELGEDGKVHRVKAVQNLDEAMSRANRVRSALLQRAVHQKVLKYCTAEILQENYFHAAFEAMKSITARIRQLSGLTADGDAIVGQAFGFAKGAKPMVAINCLSTETEEGEQRGFANLLKGLYGTIRNPLAHTPKIEWSMTEQDLLDILTVVSLVHRKLDQARQT